MRLSNKVVSSNRIVLIIKFEVLYNIAKTLILKAIVKIIFIIFIIINNKIVKTKTSFLIIK